jgi:hypothetical protein
MRQLLRANSGHEIRGPRRCPSTVALQLGRGRAAPGRRPGPMAHATAASGARATAVDGRARSPDVLVLQPPQRDHLSRLEPHPPAGLRARRTPLRNLRQPQPQPTPALPRDLELRRPPSHPTAARQWSELHVDLYLAYVFEVWEERSRHEWALDFVELAAYGMTVGTLPADLPPDAVRFEAHAEPPDIGEVTAHAELGVVICEQIATRPPDASSRALQRSRGRLDHRAA